MSINFLTIPATIRTGGQFIEYSNAQATSGLLAAMPNNNLIIALQRSSGGTLAANTLSPIASVADARVKWGQGSIMANMVQAWFDMNPYLPLYGIGITPTGAAAVGGFVFTGTATAAGQVNAYICGQKVTCSVSVGDTSIVVATALYNAIVAYCLLTDLPVVASNGTPSTTTITALDTGSHGNANTILGGGIDLRINYNAGDYLPAGLACTITVMTGGTLFPVLSTAIAAMGATWFTTVVTHLNDSTQVGLLEANALTQWGPMIMQDQQVYFGGTGSRAVQESECPVARNSPFSTYMGGGLSPTPGWVWAAQAACADASTSDPAQPRGQVLLTDCLPPGPGLNFVWSDRNAMLGEGISTYTVVGGQCYTERLITTYQKAASGAADISYMSIETMRTLAYMRYTWRTWIALKFPRFKLAADGTTFDPAQKIVTPKRITDEAIAWFQSMIDAGLGYNKPQFILALAGQVQINQTDPNRVDMIMTPQLIRCFRTLAAQIQFLL